MKYVSGLKPKLWYYYNPGLKAGVSRVKIFSLRGSALAVLGALCAAVSLRTLREALGVVNKFYVYYIK
jgi:hypothetical protein